MNIVDEKTLEDRLIDLVKRHNNNGQTSFGNIETELAPYMEITGDVSLEVAPNVIVWLGISRALADLMQSEKVTQAIVPVPCDQMVYWIDSNRLPNIPTTDRVPENGYKKPHWLPVVFRLRTPKD